MPRTLDLSRKAQQRAEKVIPGGVNSPVRAFTSVGGDPPIIVRGVGAYLWDLDANEYIDYVGSWGPLILGHAFKPVVAAITNAARNGSSYGASTPVEAELAELIISAMPSIEKIRFVSSGTEAAMSAIRLARAATNRKIIIKFEGCYHGHADYLLVRAGSGVATLGIPGSAGVPEEFTQFTVALPYNDVKAVKQAFKKFKGQVAAVIVEPVVGNMGCVPPAPGFLESLREQTEKDGALLIFDEVMTGFRVAWGGAQQIYKIAPDITCLGKIIGGGLPVGAYGASARFMDMIAPLGNVYQAGTLSGNPVAMSAGLATLRYLNENPDAYDKLEFNSNMLVEGVAAAAHDAGVKLACNRVGSMFTWFFRKKDGNVWDWATAAQSDAPRFGRFHNAMLENGVYLPPSQYEAAFLSTAHSVEDIEQTINAARKAFQEI